MKRSNFIGKIILVAVFALSAFSCSDDDENGNSQMTIAEIAADNTDFSTLVAALNRAGLTSTLDGSGTYTVFAPTNAAFSSFLSANGFANIDAVPVAVLREVLLNHVLSTEEFSGDLETGYVKTLAKGSASATNTLSMYIDMTSGVVINGGTANGGATVTDTDIDASNGVIHVVNGVIGLPTVVNHAIANPEFTSLVAALTRDDQPNFVSVLSGNTTSYTVFAPTNAAFTSLFGELGASGLGDIDGPTLEGVLSYHVVAGANVLSTDLTNNMSVEPLGGGSFTIQTTGGAKIIDANDRVSNIIATDVQASNGVVHVLDKVLLP